MLVARQFALHGSVFDGCLDLPSVYVCLYSSQIPLGSVQLPSYLSSSLHVCSQSWSGVVMPPTLASEAGRVPGARFKGAAG